LKFSHFFIDRPIFAIALSAVIVLAGAVAYFTLPVAQYPDIAPPTVQIQASYPGADPETLAETVATPIEEQVNGVENMLYMSSQMTSNGSVLALRRHDAQRF
jgi:multidrug efflux pump subunit AcrB